MKNIPFNRPCFVGKELVYIRDAVKQGQISGNGKYTKKCHDLLENRFGTKKALLTTSCTSALEMAAILINLKPGDEVILPTFTFVSTANAFVLRGAIPKFIDVREDTLNMDETKVELAVSARTKSIFAVHYAGVGCEMDTVMKIAARNQLLVVEDAAQGIDATYKGRFLGTIGHFGAFSFHETKNCISGEGGALFVNCIRDGRRAEIIWEKGTDRCQFYRGEVDKYTWRDIGSSYLPSDLIAAFLVAQLEHLEYIKSKRKKIFEFYQQSLQPLADRGMFRLPVIPSYCESNYHGFYILLPSEVDRNRLMGRLKKKGILAIFHYLPLHLSQMGRKFGYQKGQFPVSERVSKTILRLPFYNDLTKDDLNRIVTAIRKEI